MTSTGGLDPFDMWRQMLGRLETSFNSMANDSMSGEQLNKAIGQFSEVSMGMRQAYDKALEKYLKAIRVPSRADVVALLERLDRIEDKLDTLTAAVARPGAEARPARTRRPPTPDAAESAAAAGTAAAAAAAATAAARKAQSAAKSGGKEP